MPERPPRLWQTCQCGSFAASKRTPGDNRRRAVDRGHPWYGSSVRRASTVVCSLFMAITFTGCSSGRQLVGSTTTSAPSLASQQNRFVRAVHRDFPNSAVLSNKQNVTLGDGVCLDLQEGMSVSVIAVHFETAVNGKGLPQQFVAALLIESTIFLCPKYRSVVENG